MYENFYSFTAMPFQLTPDNRFYFGSQEHRRAMAFLAYGLSQREGFVVVTGEIGAGKTTLVEQLLSTLNLNDYVVARVVTTQLDGYDTLCVIANAFGIPSDGIEKGTLISRVKQFFSVLQEQGKHGLVIVDEAQSLTMEAVEELRMLSNLTAGPRAPFQGILLGQPEFRVTLSSPELQQLRQRVIASCHLGALTAEDTRKYIEHRLARVGWTTDPRFTTGAFEEIHRHSGGIPRRINTLCSRLLLLGFLDERHVIDASAVMNVAQEMANELVASGPREPVSLPIQPGLPFERNLAPEQLDDGYGGLRARLDRVEITTARHDRAITHALNLALKYLPAQEGK